jgi:PTS system nitrogen regulatory IIA component
VIAVQQLFGNLLEKWSRLWAYDRYVREREREAGSGGNRQDPVKEKGLMNSVGRLLSPETILFDLDAMSKEQVFEQVGALFELRNGIAQKQVAEALGAREKMGSTGLGQGVGLPHARIKGLPEAMAAFVRLKKPIAFSAPDEKPVSELLVLLVPERATEQHLQMLAEFAQMLGDRQFRERVRACRDAGAVSRLLADWSPA